MGKARRAAECHPDRPHWARGKCSPCYQTWWKAENPERFKNRPRRPASCHPDKPVLAQDLCGTCYRRKWRLENPGAEWDRQAVASRRAYASRTPEQRREIILGRYGLTPETFDQMLAEQGGKCAACGGGSGRRPFQVDHCHQTGRVRGLLCGNCNSALGHARDDRDRLRALIQYLDRDQAAHPAP
ncbi:endonuclease domain-containing protein [Micromonospora sp. NPDC049048]|uniref:endonuclease domain-containing protein n=1 Tax=Micromonospora sp. NPDC049048 TaxID=3364263 RepID=UPI0037196F33